MKIPFIIKGILEGWEYISDHPVIYAFCRRLELINEKITSKGKLFLTTNSNDEIKKAFYSWMEKTLAVIADTGQVKETLQGADVDEFITMPSGQQLNTIADFLDIYTAVDTTELEKFQIGYQVVYFFCLFKSLVTTYGTITLEGNTLKGADCSNLNAQFIIWVEDVIRPYLEKEE